MYEISNFMSDLKSLRKTNSLVCYRGHANKYWKNEPAIMRINNSSLFDRERSATKELMSSHPDKFGPDQSMFDHLVTMQHYGLPTRLLDVTKNPLVALYFATDSSDRVSDGKIIRFAIPESREKYYDSDTLSCLSNLSNISREDKREIGDYLRKTKGFDPNNSSDIEKFNRINPIKKILDFIRGEKPYFKPNINPYDLYYPVYAHPKLNNERILIQSGAFIVYGNRSDINYAYPNKIEEEEIIIPHSAKQIIRQELSMLGISESVLFPGLEQSAIRIRERYNRT